MKVLSILRLKKVQRKLRFTVEVYMSSMAEMRIYKSSAILMNNML